MARPFPGRRSRKLFAGRGDGYRYPGHLAGRFTEPRELQGFRKWNVAALDERLIPLVDADPLYDVVHGFMGPDLMVTKTQMIVLPPDCLDSPFLHTDAGGMADIVESTAASPLMVSAQVFLTDLPEPGMGNFTCVPGSHQRRYPWSADNPRRSQIDGPLGQDIPMGIRRQFSPAPVTWRCSSTRCGTASPTTSRRNHAAA